MDLPDQSQWDETTCNMAVCPHPQCWATIRRIEGGHPRILGSPCTAPLEVHDELPVLTVVNISDSCFQPERQPHHHLPRFFFTEPHSLLSQHSKFDSKFQGRPRKDLPGKDLLRCTDRSSKASHRLKKLPVLNLNETQLPGPQDVRNMTVIWIPKEAEEHVGVLHGEMKVCVTARAAASSSVFQAKRRRKVTEPKSAGSAAPSPLLSGGNSGEDQTDPIPVIPQSSGAGDPAFTNPPPLRTPAEKRIVRSQAGKEEGKAPGVKHESSLVLPAQQAVGMPPSTAHWFEQLNSELLPFWNRLGTGDLMMDLLVGAGKTTPCPKMKTQVALTRRRPALEKSRPGSALSTQRFLSVRRLALQTPASRYPEHLKKLNYNQKMEGHREQQRQQQRKLTPAEEQGAKKKRSSDPGSQSSLQRRSGHKTLPGQERNKKQQWQIKKKGPTLKQYSAERPQTDSAENSPESFSDPKLSQTERTIEDINTQMEFVLKVHERPPTDLSDSASRASWNSELQVLSFLQPTDDEDEENQDSGTRRGESLEA